MRILAWLVLLLLSTSSAWAQIQGIKIPTNASMGLKGAAGVGFVDFTTLSPAVHEFKLDRGMYIAASIERPFNFLNLHLVLTLSHMTANGLADYNYTRDGITYTANDIGVQARMIDLGLGLKFKLIEDYWFRPYVGGGGLGGYHELSYTTTNLASQGTGYKTKDTIMNAGYYGEVGLEIEFSQKFGIQLAGRLSDYSSKTLETLGGKSLLLRSETYYVSAMFGF